MTAILYTILGVSLGVGVTLIYLQERFVRERRLLVAMGESERAKSAKLLKDLDEQWEAECDHLKEELEACRRKIEEMEQDEGTKEVITVQDTEKITALGNEIKAKQEEYDKLLEENASLRRELAPLRQQIQEQQSEIAFLRGEVDKLKKELTEKPATASLEDDCIVFSKGGHLLPGSIARKLMGQERPGKSSRS